MEIASHFLNSWLFRCVNKWPAIDSHWLGTYAKIIIFSESFDQLILGNYASFTWGFTSYLISPLSYPVPCIFLSFSFFFFFSVPTRLF